MGEKKRRRVMIAYHEAAHGVVARRLGLSCVGIFMKPADGSTAGAQTASASFAASDAKTEEKIRGFEIDGMVALAGPVANTRVAQRASAFTEGAESDLQLAQNAAGCIALLKSGRPLPNAQEGIALPLDIVDLANETLNAIKERAEALVDEHWPAIERVGNALVARDQLAEAELDALIA